MELTPKQQTSEAVRQADNILILTGQHPSIDQVAAVVSLAAILRKFGKKVSAIVSDTMPAQTQFLDTSMVEKNLSGLRDFILKVDLKRAEVDKLRYEVQDGKLNIFLTPFQGGFSQNDVSFDYGEYHYDLVIALGVPTRTRIDRVYAEHAELFRNIPLVNLDFHRSNENYGAINLIEGTASSLCEILVALSESLQSGLIDEDIATSLLTGLMASTDRFTANHTTPKSLTVAAQMLAAGARQQAVVRGLYRDGRDRSSDRGSAGRSDGRSGQSSDRDRREMENHGQPSERRSQLRSSEESHEARPEPMQQQTPPPPIIDPGHMELAQVEDEPVATVTERMVADMPGLADVAAAAEVLRQEHRDEQADAA